MKPSEGHFAHKRFDFGVVLVLFTIAFLFYFSVFLRSALITGIDGPYYLIQVRSILETGRLVYGDPPLVFYLLAFFALTLRDLTLGVKAGVAFFSALSTLPMYLLMKRVTGRTFGGCIGMLCLAFSASFIRMMTDFMKNAVGILFLVFFIYFLHALAFDSRSPRNLPLAAIFAVTTGLTHILDLGVALLFLAVYSVVVVIFNVAVNGKVFLRSLSLVSSVLAIFVLITITSSPFLFSDYGKILSFFEDISTIPQEKPFAPIVFPQLQGPLLPVSWTMLVGVILLGLVLSVYEWKNRKTEAFALLSSTTVTGSLLGLPFIPPEWLWRFMLMEFVPFSIILSHGLSKLEAVVSTKIEDPSLKRLLTLIAIAICLSPHVVQALDMAVSVRPTISPAGYLDLTEMNGKIPTNSVVIPPGNLRYWVEYINRVEVAGAPSQRLWQSHAHVLVLFDRNRVPPYAKDLKTIYAGRIFVLAEFPPPPPHRS